MFQVVHVRVADILDDRRDLEGTGERCVFWNPEALPDSVKIRSVLLTRSIR